MVKTQHRQGDGKSLFAPALPIEVEMEVRRLARRLAQITAEHRGRFGMLTREVEVDERRFWISVGPPG